MFKKLKKAVVLIFGLQYARRSLRELCRIRKKEGVIS